MKAIKAFVMVAILACPSLALAGDGGGFLGGLLLGRVIGGGFGGGFGGGLGRQAVVLDDGFGCGVQQRVLVRQPRFVQQRVLVRQPRVLVRQPVVVRRGFRGGCL